MTVNWVNGAGGLIFTEKSKDSFDVMRSNENWDLHWIVTLR